MQAHTRGLALTNPEHRVGKRTESCELAAIVAPELTEESRAVRAAEAAVQQADAQWRDATAEASQIETN